ncbi:PLP-dependent aminotransferase family protein [Nonomuraea sp. bgisy101]|uniref:MocR-like pyridoxine biosynthesis transcription factor PdxR n=1 Tax=Nonomuraea sp. bgisy101 TaxID=3413784 RepID=UPI003D73E06F
MESQWSRLGLDLHLRLAPSHGLRAGLEHALRDAVREGRLAPGTPLPSSRALARDLNVARGTVTQAYDQLVAEGYLTSRPRSGVWVADHPAAPRRTSMPPPRTTLPPVPGVDLRSGLPDLSTFPRREWLAATRHVLRGAPNTAFGYGDPTGSAELRRVLAEYLGRARGVLTTPDHIIVCAGYAHALRLVFRTLADSGATSIAVENPSEPDYPRLAAQHGLEVRRIPVDGEGLAVAGLGGEAAVAVTPAHQYPLGVTLSPSRRARLLAWARRTGGFVIEDDYDGEFRYDRQPVGALQGLAPDRVVYAGTASKMVAPGLRIAWIAVPDDLLPLVRRSMHWDEGYVGVIDQLALAHLIRTGELDRHLRRCRVRYRRRRDRLGTAVERRLPHARLSGIAAGLHAVLHLPGTGMAEAELLTHLAGRGIAVDALSMFYGRPEEAPLGVLIGYATPPEHAFDHALRELIAGLRECLPPAGPPLP